jgi:hypothetical protein
LSHHQYYSNRTRRGAEDTSVVDVMAPLAKLAPKGVFRYHLDPCGRNSNVTIMAGTAWVCQQAVLDASENSRSLRADLCMICVRTCEHVLRRLVCMYAVCMMLLQSLCRTAATSAALAGLTAACAAEWGLQLSLPPRCCCQLLTTVGSNHCLLFSTAVVCCPFWCSSAAVCAQGPQRPRCAPGQWPEQQQRDRAGGG